MNYYANSIYLGRDIPVYVPSTDNQLYNNFYALESSGGNTSNTPYLDYYYNGRPSTQDSDIAYHGRKGARDVYHHRTCPQIIY